MGGNISADVLTQPWVHSHEEDTDNEMVFRPASFNFPRSRGRSGFDLKPDGSLVESGPGPTDRRQQSQGTWKLDGDKLVFYGGSGQPGRVLQIVSAAKDRLVVKR
jgi:hypothetical protein